MFGIDTLGRKTVVTIIFGLAVIMLVVAVVWAVFLHPAALKKEATTAKVDSAYSSGTAKSAQEAIVLQGQNADTKKGIDAQTEANSNDILTSPGAVAPLDPALNVAGLRTQCMRSIYHNTPQCRKLLESGK